MTASHNGVSRPSPKSWGAEFVRPGEVRFRLWSPSSVEMGLKLEESFISMTKLGNGWFELIARGVSPGATYTFVLPDGTEIPDPAARAQLSDVHGPSLVVDPAAYEWQAVSWKGRPWEEAAIYELHIGTFTPEGTFQAALVRLDHLKRLGVTAIEIMPVAQFAGERGWGYDGVLLYAPHNTYGSPEDMKAFIDAAHLRGLMVVLDVVYNHFGPDGNYLPRLAPEFFDGASSTPWGAAIAYERQPVRNFFIENALYWLEEFRLDGLRFDAIDQIKDTRSSPEILEEIACYIRHQLPARQIHLITEDNRNITRLHAREGDGRAQLYTAEWNDDFHTAAHVYATGETAGYFVDFRDAPLVKLGRALAEGFVYQGEASSYRRGESRGESSRHLPPSAFVDFLQNHDQIGNRAFGERLTSLIDVALLQCLEIILILSPSIPMIFMGEEWGETNPFLFFTDFEGELAEAVREGRRREFSAFHNPAEEICDPNDPTSFTASKLDWEKLARDPHDRYFHLMCHLLDLRQRHVTPLLTGMPVACGRVMVAEQGRLAIDWSVAGKTLSLRANLSPIAQTCPPYAGEVIILGPGPDAEVNYDGNLSPLSVLIALGKTEHVDAD